MKNVSKRIARTVEEYEHLFWLAARDIVFFSTYNEELDDYDNGWRAVVICNDVFYYAADSQRLPPHREHEIREMFEKYGWAGVTAWVAFERGEEPLKEIQDKEYLKAMEELKQ